MNQLSRKYNKRVEIWKVRMVADGYSGTKPDPEVFDKEVWMNLKTNVGSKATDLGITDIQNTVLFELRYREGINIEDTFFKYKGVKYVLQAPSNVNEMNNEIVVYGTR